jgi:hypothetical protein
VPVRSSYCTLTFLNTASTRQRTELLLTHSAQLSSLSFEIANATSQQSSVATNIGDEDSERDGDAPETQNREEKDDHCEDFRPHLRFTFNQKPKNIQDRYVFGSNPKTCDVILGSSNNSISGSHFRITFDDKKRLVLTDSSALRTTVSYSGRARDKIRKNPQDQKQNRERDKLNDFKWILFPRIKKSVIVRGVKVPSNPNNDDPKIEFLVEVVDTGAESCLEQYIDLRDAYLNEIQTAILFSLNIDSHLTTAGQTELHSLKQSAKQRPIWINQKEIGSGEFRTVCQAVNVSTGKTYAAKTFMRRGADFQKR